MKTRKFVVSVAIGLSAFAGINGCNGTQTRSPLGSFVTRKPSPESAPIAAKAKDSRKIAKSAQPKQRAVRQNDPVAAAIPPISQTASITEISRQLEAGQAFERAGKLPLAGAEYEKVLNTSLTDQTRSAIIEAHHRLGVIADKQGDSTTAEKHYVAALKLDPKNVEILTDRGYSQLLRNNFDAAEKSFEAVLKIDPGHRRALNNTGLLLGMTGSKEESLAAFEAAGGKAAGQANFAYMLTSRKEYPEARQHFEYALQLDPKLKIAQEGLAQLEELLVADFGEPDPTTMLAENTPLEVPMQFDGEDSTANPFASFAAQSGNSTTTISAEPVDSEFSVPQVVETGNDFLPGEEIATATPTTAAIPWWEQKPDAPQSVAVAPATSETTTPAAPAAAAPIANKPPVEIVSEPFALTVDEQPAPAVEEPNAPAQSAAVVIISPLFGDRSDDEISHVVQPTVVQPAFNTVSAHAPAPTTVVTQAPAVANSITPAGSNVAAASPEPIGPQTKTADSTVVFAGGFDAICPEATGTTLLLIRDLASENALTRRLAAGALGKLGEEARPAVPALKQLTTDADASVRIKSAVSLYQVTRQPEPSVAVLTAALADPDVRNRKAACVALGEMGPSAAPAVAALTRMQSDPDPAAKSAAAAALQSVFSE